MPRPIDITFTVGEDGQMPRPRALWLRDILKLWAGREVRLRISSPKRSSAANRFYWGCRIKPVWEALVESGQTASMDIVHRHFKHKYLPVETEEFLGRVYAKEPTTTRLDSTEFFDYMESIRCDELTLSLGLYLESPDANYHSYNLADLPY